jgi:hypothetical protein
MLTEGEYAGVVLLRERLSTSWTTFVAMVYFDLG